MMCGNRCCVSYVPLAVSNLVRLSKGGGEEDRVGPNPFTATVDIFVTGGEMLPVLVSLISTGILRTKGSSEELVMSGIWLKF